jgi:hypothetical protein
MSMLKFFRIPFATSGDVAPVDDPAELNGEVSYTQGYGPDYALDPEGGDTNRKRIERPEYNQILLSVTTALQELQSFGIPDFITTALNDGVPYPYDIGATVFQSFDNRIYRNTVAANSGIPPGFGWLDITTPLTLATLPLATTGTAGIVQLVDSLGTSLLLAPTQNLVNDVNDNANTKMNNWQLTGDSGGNVGITEGVLVTMIGGDAIDTVRSGNTVIFSGEQASTSNKGSVQLAASLGTSETLAPSLKLLNDTAALKMESFIVGAVSGTPGSLTNGETLNFLNGTGNAAGLFTLVTDVLGGINVTIGAVKATEAVQGVTFLRNDYITADPTKAATANALKSGVDFLQGQVDTLQGEVDTLQAEIDAKVLAPTILYGPVVPTEVSLTFNIDSYVPYAMVEVQWSVRAPTEYGTFLILTSNIVHGRTYIIRGNFASSSGTGFSSFRFNSNTQMSFTVDTDQVLGITQVTGIVV